jgi:uncharacterized Zn finger protein
MAEREPAALDAPSAAGGSRVASALLFCEVCGAETVHRILRVGPVARRGGPGEVQGVARCRVCRTTHRFRTPRRSESEVVLIVSRGPTSETKTLRLPRHLRLAVGGPVGEKVSKLVVRRLDSRVGTSVPHASVGELATIWASRDEGAVVAVSIVEGGRTTAETVRLPHPTRLRVGGELAIGGVELRIVGLRARGRTWKRLDDEFPADEVERVYGRRIASPPAGRRAWRSEREMPSSRARAVSIASRSRSSPGTRTTRSSPRARIDGTGAAVQSRTPR